MEAKTKISNDKLHKTESENVTEKSSERVSGEGKIADNLPVKELTQTVDISSNGNYKNDSDTSICVTHMTSCDPGHLSAPSVPANIIQPTHA